MDNRRTAPMWVLFATVTLSAAAPRALADDPLSGRDVSESRLDNGLQVVVIRQPEPADVVAWSLWIAVGSGSETVPGTTGFAHFLEHLMFLETEAWPSRARALEQLRLGVEENAWTWFDDTVYHATMPASSLDAYIAMEADRFSNARLTEAGVTREAGAVDGEYRRSLADPVQALEAGLRSVAFEDHPYGHDTIGLEADIRGMPTGGAAIADFRDQHYRPEATRIVVVGDVDPQSVHDRVAETFGGWGAAAPPPDPVPPAAPQIAPREVEIPWTSGSAPRTTFAWRGPGADHPDAPALRVAMALLVAPSGPLVETLVRTDGLAFEVTGGLEDRVDPDLVRIDVVARDRAHLDAIERTVVEHVTALTVDVDPARLDAVSSHLRYSRLTAFDDPSVLAEAVGWARRRGRTLAQEDAALAALTAEDIVDAARTWLVDATRTTARLTPTEDPP